VKDWLPPTRSPRWLLVFTIGTVVLAGALLVAGATNRGTVDGRVVANISAVSAIVMAVICGLGWLGARATWLGTVGGLAVGYIQMLWGFARASDGFGDLAALAAFLMLTTIGFGVGALIDLVWWIRSGRA
jgi:hypothetical protein